MRMAELSARTGVAVQGSWGRGTGEITGLALATSSGAAAWFDPAALTVNIGDLMARWTGDRWRSGRHRVLPPPAEAPPFR